MAMRYPGGLIATSPVNAAYPSGVWTQSQTIPYVSQNVWQNDQYWPYTTLLLHGDGTNGAQNNTFLDSSSNNFTITRNGNTTQGAFTPFQQSGYWSNYFDGSGDYLQLADSTAWDLTGDYTIEMWLYKTSSSSQTFFMLGSGGSTSILLYQNASNVIIFYTSSAVITASISAPLNQWNHIALVRSGSGSNNTVMYLNGVNVGQATNTASFTGDASNGVRIGAEYPTGYEYTGYISNVRVVKGTAVYTSAFTPSATPLTAITNTQLLTCQSNRFVDNSASPITLTVNGNTAVQAFQPFPGPTTWSASVLGGSGYFDGSGDYLTAPASGDWVFTGDYTIEGWIFSSSLSWSLWATGGSGSNDQFVCNNGDLYWDVNVTGSIVGFFTTSNLNQWVHVAVCRSGSTVKAFKNGVQSSSWTSASSIGSNATAYIGRRSDGSYQTSGYMSSIRVVKGTAVYTSAFTPPTAPLTNITNTSLLLNFTNAGIFDNAQMNDLETVGNAQVSTSVVKYGTGSMAFDGTGDNVDAPSSQATTFGTGDFCIEWWMYPTGAGSSPIMFGLGPTGGGNNFNIHYNLSSNGTIQVFIDALSGSAIMQSGVLSSSVWTHVAVTRNGSSFRLFINGTQAATYSNSGSVNSGYLRIGPGYVGYIDDFRITKGVARYITNFTPPIARMPNQ